MDKFLKQIVAVMYVCARLQIGEDVNENGIDKCKQGGKQAKGPAYPPRHRRFDFCSERGFEQLDASYPPPVPYLLLIILESRIWEISLKVAYI